MNFKKCDEAESFGESILDEPMPGLDPAVWTKNQNGEYVLTIQASEKIKTVVDWATAQFGITDPIVHITGSIASNSFSNSSDVDLHFCSETFKPDDLDEFNKVFRKEFENEFGPDTGSENGFIGIHPIEVYFQPNKFQDVMSVGCYDFTNNRWESGPDIKDTAFDPYSKYYEKDMKCVGKLADDIRNRILDVYEKALVIQRSKDEKFKAALFKKMLKSISEAAKLFAAMRAKRRVMSSPKSKEQALKMRKDQEWHIADSAFKLFDKFGYLGVLREYAKMSEDAAEAEPDADEYAGRVVDAVSNCIGKNGNQDGRLSEGEVPGMAGWDDADLKQDIRGWIDERIDDYRLDIDVIDIALHGSRTRRDFRPDSDLDVIVYYRGKPGGHAREDHIWNMLNDEPKCEIDGVKVDFWPTRDEESGNMDDVLRRNRRFELEQIDEGAKEAVSSLALALALLIPGLASAKTVGDAKRALKADPVELQMKQNEFIALLKGNDPHRDMSGYEMWQALNILALTLFGEGRGEIRFGGLDPITDSILNRTAPIPDVSRVANICVGRRAGRAFQYSFWNKNKPALADIKNKNPVLPSEIKTNVIERMAWETCLKRAAEVMTGNYAVKNSKINSYYVTAMDDPPSWTRTMTNVSAVGHHTFGYVASNDPKNTNMATMKPVRKTAKLKKTVAKPAVTPVARNRRYVVKKGDSIWKIARMHKTTARAIAMKNGISVNATIRPGQVINI